jgi:hypothetical protein
MPRLGQAVRWNRSASEHWGYVWAKYHSVIKQGVNTNRTEKGAD